ncbi:MFS transporter [Tetragenococcus halophilus]|uniref:Major facilitator superfamily transporter n=1 Tax=Tetragenococcus halophilus (strain DSM 20338 / JCM 20259 / NCIMB 9735 / NBRC 12172) TaxID=945021 RepID=A0AAN1SG17_TETHN|nr:MFS transporter [Tetragenococcus halophilus]MDN6127068.1 MFS transporter [Tetragenococcus halophilus]NWO00258.1 MFS transporter [Tetragenococcus halophilus]WJS82428.1 MFS transporter [Tetragenococcus halophilus]BAK93794.1 major facilitator superfamily transporter [Tetragenococcus halophilus NBRC 12172]GBD61808.1 major facilitator superfamily transporter [Tetragenococcus halophilus subsp. halophilus]
MNQLKANDKKALFASIFASGLDDLNVMFLSFTLGSIMAHLGLSGVEGGWISTITNLGMLAGGLVFGVLADRYNKFTVFKSTILVFSVATGMIFFTESLGYLYLMRFIAGIGVGGEYGVAISIMGGIVPSNKMGRVSSLNGIMGQLGSIGAALLAGLIAPIFGWKGLFLFGLLPVLLVAWMHFAVDEKNVTDRGAKITSDKKEKASIKELFANKKRTHQTLALMLMTTVQIAGYFGLMNWLPTMMQRSLGIEASDNLWMISTILGMCVGMLVFGNILDYFGPRLAYGIFLICSMLSVYAFTYVNSMTTLLLGGAMMGFFVNGMFSGYGAICTKLYPHHIRTIANNTILNVGRAVGGFSSVVIGFILDNAGVSQVMLFIASLYIMSFIAMISIPALRKEAYTTSDIVEVH